MPLLFPVLHAARCRLTVDAALAVPDHLLNDTLFLQVLQRLPSKRSVDFQTIDEDGDGDETVGLNIFLKFVGGGLIEDDGMLGFVLDYDSQLRH